MSNTQTGISKAAESSLSFPDDMPPVDWQAKFEALRAKPVDWQAKFDGLRAERDAAVARANALAQALEPFAKVWDPDTMEWSAYHGAGIMVRMSSITSKPDVIIPYAALKAAAALLLAAPER